MTTCLGKSYFLSVRVYAFFPFGFAKGTWDMIVLVPNHCLSFYF